jgi:hypothetical protein
MILMPMEPSVGSFTGGPFEGPFCNLYSVISSCTSLSVAASTPIKSDASTAAGSVTAVTLLTQPLAWAREAHYTVVPGYLACAYHSWQHHCCTSEHCGQKVW